MRYDTELRALHLRQVSSDVLCFGHSRGSSDPEMASSASSYGDKMFGIGNLQSEAVAIFFEEHKCKTVQAIET